MFSPQPIFGFDDPHIRHAHEHNKLHFGQKKKGTKKMGGTVTFPVVEPSTRTTEPITTGTSIIALRYKDGVMLGGDTLASYGSLARYKSVQRIKGFGNNTLIGGTGDYSDFQYICQTLDQLITEDEVQDDGYRLSPKSIHSYLTRVLYARRNKFDPLYNQLVVAGVWDGKPLLGLCDHRGTRYESDTIASGYGGYLAQPLLRKYWKEGMSRDEAKELLEKCLRVLFYRDARTINKIQIAAVTAEGIWISEPYELTTDWSSGEIIYKDAGIVYTPIYKVGDNNNQM
jgi:20S proteasome subunit beta 7